MVMMGGIRGPSASGRGGHEFDSRPFGKKFADHSVKLYCPPKASQS